MFPEQFHALRRIYECEKSIIESLARCIKWNAKGGKSGSGFLKTQGKTLNNVLRQFSKFLLNVRRSVHS